MAVVPTLAAMAALTLFQHPEAQPEDVSVDYSAFSAPAITIQRFVRGIISRVRTLIPRSRRIQMDYPWDSYAHRGRRYWLSRAFVANIGIRSADPAYPRLLGWGDDLLGI